MTVEKFRAMYRQPKECNNGDTLNSTCGKHFVRIWDFMIFDLQISGTEVLVYAIIFSIYNSKKMAFEGSRKYLAKWAGTTERTIDNALKALTEKKLILAKKRKLQGVVRNVYGINPYMLPVCELFEMENKNADRWKKVNEKRSKAGMALVDPLEYEFYADEYGGDFDSADEEYEC